MAAPLTPAPVPVPSVGGQSVTLQMALNGALTSNPDLVTLRQGTVTTASPESVEVARHFPTTLNPTLWLDYRPITLIPRDAFAQPGSTTGHQSYYHYGQDYFYFSLRQPIELKHQTTHRYNMARANYDQVRWNILQAELATLVQTYRFFQTAAYRREKYNLATQLQSFNDRLLQSLQRRLEASQIMASDVVLARVESRASRQTVKAARQDYLTALTDLRNQMGIPESAGAAEPLGEFSLPASIPPLDEQTMVQEALQNRPDIHAMQAQVASTCEAEKLARADRVPSPVVGPQYEMDEAGVQYIGFVFVTTLPIWNNGAPLVRQREAEHRRAIVAYQEAQQRAVSQVRAAVAKWNGATDLVTESIGLADEIAKEVGTLQRLFEAGQCDFTKLTQARQRLIQLENSRLDAVWAATQAQSDLLLALGIPSLIKGMLSEAQYAATPRPSAPAPAAAAAPPPPAARSPFRPAVPSASPR